MIEIECQVIHIESGMITMQHNHIFEPYQLTLLLSNYVLCNKALQTLHYGYNMEALNIHCPKENITTFM